MSVTRSSSTPLERDALLGRVSTILNKTEFTKEDSSRCEQLLRLADSLGPEARALRDVRMAEIDREFNIRGKATARDPRVETAFRDYLRHGKDILSDEQRALSVATDAAGGYLVPQSFYDIFTVSLKRHDQVFDFASMFETANGNACPFPLDDDTAQVATVVAENITSTTADAVFDRVLFGKCPSWRSGQVRASMEVAADSAFDLSGLLAGAFARRFARGIGATFVTTLLSQATLGKTAASASAVTPDEVLDLMGSVDAAHAQRGAFLMNFSTYISVAKIKGSGGSYMVPPTVDSEGRPLLHGRPVYLSPSMPNIATTAKPVVFGDLSRFIRRQVRNSLQVKTFVERYAELAQVGYESYWRVDGNLAKTANAPVPVKFLQNA